MKDLVMDNEIGVISDDLGENSKILYGGWIAPKLYFLEYVQKCEDQGIPKDKLNVDMFESIMLGEAIKIDMQRDFKCINVNRSSIDNFSILKLNSLEKQINTDQGKGRHFVGDNSVPLFHASIK
jgi:hypothetical protein